MSFVTNVILSCATEEDEALLPAVNTYFAAGKNPCLVGIDDASLPADWNATTFPARFFFGAPDQLDLADFRRHLRKLKWRYPESLQLIVMDHEDFVFRVLQVFPEDYACVEATMINFVQNAGMSWPPDFMAALSLGAVPTTQPNRRRHPRRSRGR